MPDNMQQRRDEILAKKAKLAELKRQRELRAREVSASRQSIGSASDVKLPLSHNVMELTITAYLTNTGASWCRSRRTRQVNIRVIRG